MDLELIRYYSKSYDGHEAERLLSFLPLIPLIVAWCAIIIATNMTNPFFNSLRKGTSAEKPTKWTTLKWRLILLAFALVITVFSGLANAEAVDIFSYTLPERFMDAMQGGFAFCEGWLELVLYYIVMPPLTIFFFVKSIIEVLCSRQIISPEATIAKRLGGQKGFAQTACFAFYFIVYCLTADGSSLGVFSDTDFILINIFYFLASFLWVFRKTWYDFESDLEELNQQGETKR